MLRDFEDSDTLSVFDSFLPEILLLLPLKRFHWCIAGDVKSDTSSTMVRLEVCGTSGSRLVRRRSGRIGKCGALSARSGTPGNVAPTLISFHHDRSLSLTACSYYDSICETET